MSSTDVILKEFDPIEDGTFINVLLYKDTFNLELYNNFKQAIDEKSGGSIDEKLQAELLRKIPFVIQYLRLLNEKVIKQLAGLSKDSIKGTDNVKLAEYCVRLSTDIHWFVDQYIEQ